MEYQFIAGFFAGVATAVPFIAIGFWFVYTKISAHIRQIVNEYGRS
ncbi:P3a [Mallotus japonicus virus A]|uniref:P3a n=1 Tax=Mallotus japonicus virus A TaxID=2977935 RepID=A0AAE9NWL0_9VIRU|nr:P3a [Mallotus japonicus virus A]